MKEILKTDLILDFMKSMGWSKTKFCKTCKVTRLTFEKILNKNYHFSIKSLFRIAKVMNIEVWELFNE